VALMARAIAANVVALDDERIATRNLAPGQRVYDEDLLTIDGAEYRSWNPSRSKLGSYIMKGGRNFPLTEKSRVLYLGAANGTTPSHVSDIVSQGTLVAVEFSFRSFRDLLRVAGPRPNMVPVLADAWRPELYERYIGKVDLLFQDIAQRQQAQIFAKNVNRFKPTMGILAVKARSVDVAANPRDVYQQVSADVEALTGYSVIETIDLGPFEKDHAAIVITPGGGRKREPHAAPRAERRDERAAPPPPRDERPRFEKRPGGFGPKGGGGAPSSGFGPKKFEKRPYDKKERPGGHGKPRREWR
jgi:fibrillarin-like pre-rRNA processing protein